MSGSDRSRTPGRPHDDPRPLGELIGPPPRDISADPIRRAGPPGWRGESGAAASGGDERGTPQMGGRPPGGPSSAEDRSEGIRRNLSEILALLASGSDMRVGPGPAGGGLGSFLSRLIPPGSRAAAEEDRRLAGPEALANGRGLVASILAAIPADVTRPVGPYRRVLMTPAEVYAIENGGGHGISKAQALDRLGLPVDSFVDDRELRLSSGCYECLVRSDQFPVVHLGEVVPVHAVPPPAPEKPGPAGII